MNRLTRRLGRTIEIILKRKKLTALLSSLIALGSLGLIGLVPQNLFEAEDYPYFTVNVRLPRNASRTAVLEAVRTMEEKLEPLGRDGEVNGIHTLIGEEGDNRAAMTISLKNRSEGRSRPVGAFLEEARTLLADFNAADEIRFSKAVNGPPTDPPVALRIYGNRIEELTAAETALKKILYSYPELYGISSNQNPGPPVRSVTISSSKAARYGVFPGAAVETLKARLDGIPVGTLFEDNESSTIFLRMEPLSSDETDTIRTLLFSSPRGLTPFSAVAEMAPDTSVSEVRRINGRREISLSAETTDKSRIRQINSTLRKEGSRLTELYPEIEVSIGGEFAEFEDLIFQILQVFLVGIFLIYIILGTQFKSYGQPLVILASVPFSFSGIVFYLLLTGTAFSTTVLYAAVALAGIAVNDSIVLVSFINELRREGTDTTKAVIRAVEIRFRPILLTSLTTIAGLLPTALGIGGRSAVWGPMAGTIIVGLVFSTATALVVVPCFYLIYASGKKNRKLGSPM